MMEGKLTPIYRELADKGANFWGHNIVQHERMIHKMIARTGSRTLLDYGCGRGDPWASGWAAKLGVDSVALYDPAFPQHDKLPEGTFDGVLCSDVLEHVPKDEVTALIAMLFNKAECFVWASVCCRPAKKRLPDGTNMHVTVAPVSWWDSLFHAEQERAARGGKLLRYHLTETP